MTGRKVEGFYRRPLCCTRWSATFLLDCTVYRVCKRSYLDLEASRFAWSIRQDHSMPAAVIASNFGGGSQKSFAPYMLQYMTLQHHNVKLMAVACSKTDSQQLTTSHQVQQYTIDDKMCAGAFEGWKFLARLPQSPRISHRRYPQ